MADQNQGSSVAASLASMVGISTNSGTVSNPTNSGKQRMGSTKIVTPVTSGKPKAPPPGQTPARVPPKALQLPGHPPKAAKPPMPQAPAYSAQNPPLGTAPPAAPHPGLKPPYPDARSAQPTMMPNGSTVMPPAVGFMAPNMPPRVPATFIPGMSGLLGR